MRAVGLLSPPGGNRRVRVIVILAAGILLAPTGLALGATGAPVASGHDGGTSQASSDLTLPLASEAVTHQGSSAPTVMPGPLRSRYGVDALLNSTGTTVFPTNITLGVLVWGDGYDQSDLDQFFSNDYPSEFPRPKVIPLPVDGAPAPGPAAWDDPSNGSRELTLDIEWAASAAPGATIYAIYGPGGVSPPYSPTNLAIEDALDAAQALGNLSVLSLSWGEPQGSVPSLESVLQQDFENLTAAGTTVVASSGDDGGAPNAPSNKPCTDGAGVDFPAASPSVLAVGGTSLVNGTETAWDFSGGGSSQLANDPVPSWQEQGSASMEAVTATGRAVPDVASSAANDSFFFDNQEYSGFGTSFAAPFWAGVLADVDSRDAPSSTHGLGMITPVFYDLGAEQEVAATPTPALTGVSGGGNCFYSATKGWNPVTGWGTPNALALADDLTPTALASYQPVSLVLSPDRGVSSGATITANVTLASGSPLIGGSIDLAVLSSTSAEPVKRLTGTFHPGSLSWSGTFVLPANVSGRWANVSVLVTQGDHSGIASGAVGGPPPVSPAPSWLSDLESTQVLLALILLGLFALLLMSGRRRTVPGGPSPAALAGAAPPSGGPPLPPPPVGGAPYTPFCWRCGTALTGHESSCPACGARFQG